MAFCKFYPHTERVSLNASLTGAGTFRSSGELAAELKLASPKQYSCFLHKVKHHQAKFDWVQLCVSPVSRVKNDEYLCRESIPRGHAIVRKTPNFDPYTTGTNRLAVMGHLPYSPVVIPFLQDRTKERSSLGWLKYGIASHTVILSYHCTVGATN